MKTFLLALGLMAGAHAAEKSPLREVSVIVTKEGYYPKHLTVFQGEKVRFYVTSTVETPDCVIIQGHKVFLAATKGKITEGETTFDQAGTFAFYCPSSKHDGKITVLQRQDQRQRRGIASDPEVWTPKEY